MTWSKIGFTQPKPEKSQSGLTYFRKIRGIVKKCLHLDIKRACRPLILCYIEAIVFQKSPWPISYHSNIALLRHGALCISTLRLSLHNVKFNKGKIFVLIIYILSKMALLILMFTQLLPRASTLNMTTS